MKWYIAVRKHEDGSYHNTMLSMKKSYEAMKKLVDYHVNNTPKMTCTYVIVEVDEEEL